jgi:U32 family peptidase
MINVMVHCASWGESCANDLIRHHLVIQCRSPPVPPSTNVVPELLAPAGGPDAFRAAVANGADAVYLGVESLNARRGAENFTLDGLGEVCRYAHLRGVRVYLTANTVVLESELDEAVELVDHAWEAGVDAVIVQDLGLLRALRTLLPDVRIHASTQMNAHNTLTVQALGALGVSRVTLSREVSLEEIGGFAHGGGIEVESFVHGALCVCYSGQCLMSSLIGRRSANRGLCAQPCRLPYDLLDASGTVLDSPGAHLLSPRDLAGIAVLPDLVRSGVAALKIEGRMKSAEYVALVTGVYRAALDRAAGAPDSFEVRDGELAVLGESFSRGFSEAYLIGERGNDMMSYQRPNNRGVPVGRVSAVASGRATLSLDAPLDSRDTIEFWTSAGRFAQPAGPLEYAGGQHAGAPAGTRVTVGVEHSVTTGDRVFRVRNAALSDAARRTYSEETGGAPLAFDVRLVVGEPLQVLVSDGRGRQGSATGDVVERARTKAVNAEEVAEHIGRLGGTPYSVGDWNLTMSPDVGIGFSALHRVRRGALASYEHALLQPWVARKRVKPRLPRPTRRDAERTARPQLVVSVDDLATARACIAAGADRAHVPIDALHPAEPLEAGVVPMLPRIAHDEEVAAALSWCAPSRGVVAGNLGVLREAARRGAVVEAHWSLNAVNAYAVEQLVDLGANSVWLSPELSGRQIAELTATSSAALGVAVWGAQEVMVTEHCAFMAQGPCTRACGSCERRSAARVLRDRKGYLFPVRTDLWGRSHVYNSVPLDLVPVLREVLDTGVAAVRLDLEMLTPSQAAAQVARTSRALAAVGTGIDAPTPRAVGAPTTTGHFFRGLL